MKTDAEKHWLVEYAETMRMEGRSILDPAAVELANVFIGAMEGLVLGPRICMRPTVGRVAELVRAHKTASEIVRKRELEVFAK